MKFPRTYNNAFVYAIIFTIIVTIAAVVIYGSLSKWQNSMVERNKQVCQLYVDKLHDASFEPINMLGKLGLLENSDFSSGEIRQIETALKSVSERILITEYGLEGGYYLASPDEFYGYSFPSSPPPVPVYGPPPRSYNIIKEQSLKSLNEQRMIVDLHAFDAAIFPLATTPIVYNTKTVGVVWVRIHIQNELPVIKLKRVVNIVAGISILGFFVLMLLSALLGGEIQGIKKEMEQLRKDPGTRLRKRWGIFGYITSNINIMLDTIQEEDRQRQVLERELNQKEKQAALGNMIAGVAHEVKTPLAIIKTRIQMWQKEVQKNNDLATHISPESMDLVIKETDRLTALVNRLLIFSRPVDKRMKPTDINQLIREVLSFINIERSENHIIIEENLHPALPMVLSDENALKQVIINIFENSIESMSGTGTIHIHSYPDDDQKRLVIEISDSGTGISDEIIDSIFDPFFTSKDTGAGLGLAISYQIIKAHNGEILLSNNPDRGVRCIIKLPFVK